MRFLSPALIASMLALTACNSTKKPSEANFRAAINHYLAKHLDALHGPTPPQPVKRYELTAEGQKYLQKTSGIFGQTASFCYGEKTVDSIVKWTEPVTIGAATQTEVTYTYKIADLAPWAERSDMQREFGDVRATVSGISKSNEIVDLQLTNQGWEAPAP